MKKRQAAEAAPLFSMALFVLMLGFILSMVLLGSGLYVSLVRSQQRNSDLRASLSYVTVRVRAADEAGAISVRKGPEGDLLALAEPLAQTGYETRIYLYQGSLMEEYVPAQSLVQPEKAQTITRTECFALALERGLLTVTTGEGESKIILHTEGGVE